jgi:tRNA threonylcarbamoyladenosine biosynthesis protein TsaB
MCAILAIETSGEPASLALVRDGCVATDLEFTAPRRLSQTLMVRMDELLGRAGASVGDVTAAAVSLGPGSFTGLRIGVGTANALAQVNGWRIVGMPTHHAIAERAAGTADGLVCVVTAARADEVYATLLSRGESGWQERRPCGVYRIGELKQLLVEVGERVALCGDGAAAWSEQLRDVGDVQLGAAQPPRAREVGLLAELRLRSGEVDAREDVRPLYVRPSQAEAVRGIDLGLAR